MLVYTHAEARAAVGLSPFEFGNIEGSKYGTLAIPAIAAFLVSGAFRVTELKNHLNLEHGEDDDMLLQLINSAIEQVEIFTGRIITPRIRQASYKKDRDRSLPANVLLPEKIYGFDPSSDAAPGVSVFHLRGHADDMSEVSLSAPMFAPGVSNVGLRLWLTDGWPDELSHEGAFLTVEYVTDTVLQVASGVSDIVKQAVKLMVGGAYENRESEVMPGRIEANPALMRLLHPLRTLRNYRGL